MGVQQAASLHRVLETQRSLLVVLSQIRQTLDQQWDLEIVALTHLDLRVVAALELQRGAQDHEDPAQHHVRRLVEEVEVELRGVQQHLGGGEEWHG